MTDPKGGYDQYLRQLNRENGGDGDTEVPSRELMNSPIVLDVEAREVERIEDILADYDYLERWRTDNADFMLQAESNPAVYPAADEERADINERAIEILDRLVTAVRRIWNGENRVIMPHYTKRLEELVHVAREAADGDSNDAEIEALQWALEEALSLLGRDDLR